MSSDDYGDSKSPKADDRLPSLTALRCFAMAAQTENFGRAADALHLTHGAVSRAVRLLEDDLGVALFERRSRRVFLTADGRRLAEAVREGFGVIAAAAMSLRSRQRRGQITLSCEPTLLMRWLIPRLADLEAVHPDLTLRLVAGGGSVRWGGEIDMAIRRADFPLPPDVVCAPLFEERIGPVCRTDLVGRFFETTRGRSLLRPNTTLLHTRTRPSAWSDWFLASGRGPANNPDRHFDHFHLSLQAALAGIGVAIGPQQMVRDDVAAGILCAPAGFVPDGSHYVLLSPRSPSAEGSASHATLSAWLKAAAR